MHVNLLPRGVKLKAHFRGTLRRWGFIWAATTACAFVYCSVQLRELLAARTDQELLNTRCQALRTMQSEMDAGREELLQLLAEKKILEQLGPEDHLLDLLGVIGRASQPVAGKLRLQQLRLVSSPRTSTSTPVPPPAQAGTNQPPAPTATLNLQGIADNGDVLGQFVAGLHASGVFQRVDLKSSSQLSGSDSGRQYQLECRYEDQP